MAFLLLVDPLVPSWGPVDKFGRFEPDPDLAFGRFGGVRSTARCEQSRNYIDSTALVRIDGNVGVAASRGK